MLKLPIQGNHDSRYLPLSVSAGLPCIEMKYEYFGGILGYWKTRFFTILELSTLLVCGCTIKLTWVLIATQFFFSKYSNTLLFFQKNVV